jgi:hypothetical protein
VGQVNYDNALMLLIGELNAGGAAAWVNVVADKKQSDGMLKECLLLGDNDVVGCYLDNPFSVYGEPFLFLSDELDSGDAIPAHTGALRDLVFVKIAPEDADFVRSTRAHSRDSIRRWRRNLNNTYGPVAHDALNSPLGARHWMGDGFIEFTGTKAKIKLPQFTIDRQTPKCQADARHTGLVVSRGIFYAHKEGYVSDWLFDKHNANYTAGAALILAEGRA